MSIFDNVPGAPIGQGQHGIARVGRAIVAIIYDWRAVQSPHFVLDETGQKDPTQSHLPVLYASGIVRRYWIRNPPERLTVTLTPAPGTYRFGQPRPPVPRPLTFTGRVTYFAKTQCILSEGDIVYD